MKEQFYINPFYDGVMMFTFPDTLPPKQRTGKKQNRVFENYLRTHLIGVDNKGHWPLTQKLMICLTVTGTEKWVEYCDVDNITKAVLDCFNGIVIKDDRQVYSLTVEKRVDNHNGLIIGIKAINSHEDYYGVNLPVYFLDKEDKSDKKVWWLVFNDSLNPKKTF